MNRLCFFFVFMMGLFTTGCSASVDDGDLETYSKEGDFPAPGPNYLACDADSFVMSCGCSSDAAIRTIAPTKIAPLSLNGCMCESIEPKGTMRIETLCLRRKQ